MKSVLTTIVLAAAAALAFAEEKPVTEKLRDAAAGAVDTTKDVARDAKDAVVGAAKRAGAATRSAWRKTKAFVSEDAPTYRDGAAQTLTDLGREIREVKAKLPASYPAYFHTRLLALEQQYEFLGGHLSKLSSEQIKMRTSRERYAFDQCVGSLEEAIDQAKDEAESLSKAEQK